MYQLYDNDGTWGIINHAGQLELMDVYAYDKNDDDRKGRMEILVDKLNEIVSGGALDVD